jgi:DNA-binding transcriptional regulator YdaS (Cro superfamily)
LLDYQNNGNGAKMTSLRPLIERAIEIAGSQKNLAERARLSQQGVSYLLNHAPRIAAETAIAIERATGGEIRREQLRPDIFGG